MTRRHRSTGRPVVLALTALSVVCGGATGCIVGGGDDTTVPVISADAGEGGAQDGSVRDATSAPSDGAGASPDARDAQADATLPQDAPGEASGSATASLSSAPIDFGAVPCGTAAATKTLSIGNTGYVALAVSATTTGTAFSVSPTQLSVTPGATGTLTVSANVQGSATAGAVLTGSLGIFTDDPANGRIAIPLTATPTGVSVSLTPGTGNPVTFPATSAGSASTQSFAIANNGNAPATISVTAPSPAAGFSFLSGGLTPAAPVVVAPHQTATAEVQYAPTQGTNGQPTTATSTLTVTGSASCGASLSSIAFSGVGVLGSISGFPQVLDFGDVDCGGSAPAPQSFTLVNSGTVDELITNCQVSTPDGSSVACNAGSMPVDASAAATFAATLPSQTIPANGGSLVVTVDGPAVPSTSSQQALKATLTLTVDPPTSPSLPAIALMEQPTGAVLAFDPQTFGSFGSPIVLLGPLAAQSFNVVNTGNWPPSGGAGVSLAVVSSGSSTLDGGADGGAELAQAFSVLSPTLSVPAGGAAAEQNDTLQFSPVVAGVNAAMLTMSVDPGTPLCAPLPSVTLVGTGIGAGASVAPSALSFLAPCDGEQPGPQVFLVTNSGTRDLNWQMTPITGAGASRYTATASPPPGLLQPGQSAAVTVTVLPFLALPPGVAPLTPDPGSLAAQVTVTTDVPFDGGHLVAFGEIPVGDQFSLSASSLQFGQFPVGEATLPQPFTVTNAANHGSPDGHYSLVILGAGGSAYTLAPPATNADLGAGATSAPEKLSFEPTSAIPYPATIAITTTDTILCAPLPPPIALMGTGSAGHVSVSPGTVTFGDGAAGFVDCGTSAAPRAITLTNAASAAGGNQAFDVTGIALGKQGTGAPFAFSTSAATAPPFGVPVGGGVTITISPNAIPTTADPNDASLFQDSLTITTDATGDMPHVIPLVMQARGAVIASTPLVTTWNFGTITVGSIGTFTNTIENTGNAGFSVSLAGLAQPGIFGLSQSVAAASGFSSLVGQFSPPALDGSWSDQGTLVMSATHAFCAGPPPGWQATGPTTWQGPAINLSGSSNSSPPVSISATALAFPTTDCGGAPPAGQTLTLANGTNQAQAYTAQILASVRPNAYTIGSALDGSDAGATSGVIPAAGVATILVTPNGVIPGPGVLAGSYAATLEIDVATSPVTTYTIPISWALNGAVLSLAPGGTPFIDGSGVPFYVADSTVGHLLPMTNTGTAAVTLDFAIQPPGAFTFSPSTPISLPPGIGSSPQLLDVSASPMCPPSPLLAGVATFLYVSGPVCQPFVLAVPGSGVSPAPGVSVHYCSGTF